jgi:hypothetical protein
MRVNRGKLRPVEHFLSFYLAFEFGMIIRHVQPGEPLPLISSVPDEAILFPIYSQGPDTWGFIIRHGAAGVTQIRKTFAGQQPPILLKLRPSEWPTDGDKVRELLQQSAEAFVEYLATGATTILP